MVNAKAAQSVKVFRSPEAGGAFGSSNLPNNVEDSLRVISEIVAYRVGSCVDGGEINMYLSPTDVQDFLQRYAPVDQRSLSNLDTLCAITDSAITAVQRNFQTWYMVKPAPHVALHIAVCAYDQGLLLKSGGASPIEQASIERLKVVADQPLWLGCRVKINTPKIQSESSAAVKQMVWISNRLQESTISASAEDICNLVDQLGQGAYHEFKQLWAGEIEDRDEKQRIGVLSCAGRLARELSREAHGEVILEQVYSDPDDRLAGVLSAAQIVAIERKLGLKTFSPKVLVQDIEAPHVLPLHLLVVASDADQDMFVRREALDRLAQIVGDHADLATLVQIIGSESTPLCVRFAAEVARRRWSKGDAESVVSQD